MSKKHSILPASSCERWWNCPGSVNAIKDIPNPPNKYMAEGIVAHKIAETAIKNPEMNLDSLIGTTQIQDGFEIEVTEEMIDAVIRYLEYVLGVWNLQGRHPLRLEQKIELTEVNALMFGTADCVLVIPFDTVHIFDYKHGQGKRVSAWENKQLLYYALGVMLQEDCPKFVIHVCQPRIEDGFTRFEGSLADILRFRDDLAKKAAEALDPKAPLLPGDWCKGTFCPARVTCTALSNLAGELIKNDFSVLPLIESLPIEKIIKILKYEDTIKDWMAKVREHAKELMIQGQDIPGYKIVQSFGHAKWIDEEVVVAEFEDELGDKLWEKKLISPSKLEKLLGKKKLGENFRDEYTTRPEAGFKIVETEEKGEPIKTIKAQEDFK